MRLNRWCYFMYVPGSSNRFEFGVAVAVSVQYGIAVQCPVAWELLLILFMLKDFHAFKISKELYLACKKLKLPRYLQDQLLRASSSVALNVAEGSGKQTDKEQRRYYAISLGSLRECEAILELENINDPGLSQKLDRLGAILFTLCRPRENRTKKLYGTETSTETTNPNRKNL